MRRCWNHKTVEAIVIRKAIKALVLGDAVTTMIGRHGKAVDRLNMVVGGMTSRRIVVKRREKRAPETYDDTDRMDHISACCPICREVIRDLFYKLGDTRRPIESLEIRLRTLEDSKDLDYKFLNQNIRKLFGMVRDLKRRVAGAPSSSRGA